MNIESVVSAAMAVALTYLAKGGEEIAKGVGKDLWELIKRPFTKEKDKDLINSLEQNPENVKAKSIVEYKLIEFLEDNPTLAIELKELCERVPALDPNETNRQVIEGNENIGIQNTTDSTIIIKK